MKLITLVALAILSCSMPGVEQDRYTASMYGFGISKHFDGYNNYNDLNYGLGIGLAYQLPDQYDTSNHGELTLVAGGYRDSYGKQARFCMPGVRLTWGDRVAWHAWAGINAGYFVGSTFQGLGMMPSLGAGWDRYDTCLVVAPGLVSGFVKVDLARW